MAVVVVVVGDLLLDRDITGVADRLSPDAPVPVLTQTSTTIRLGGAGMAAAFLAQTGAEVVLIGAIGINDAGVTAQSLLDEWGVRLIRIPYDGQTPEKIRLMSGRHPLLRLDRGTGRGEFGDLPPAAVATLSAAAAVVVSDYGRGVTGIPAVRRVLTEVATRVPMVWDPHPQGSTPVPGVRLACPNRAEAATFSAVHGADLDRYGERDLAAVAAQARLLRSVWHVDAVAVTLGPGGAMLAEGDQVPLPLPAPAGVNGDSCGAGDRFATAAMIALAGGRSIRTAVADAIAAASRYVASRGPESLVDSPVMGGTQ